METDTLQLVDLLGHRVSACLRSAVGGRARVCSSGHALPVDLASTAGPDRSGEE